MTVSPIYRKCRLCPRACEADRLTGTGFCRQGAYPRISGFGLHRWEEPCISGKNGSGTVFFTGCTLACCYCQNYKISQQNLGYSLTPKELSRVFNHLQDIGAHNINLVSPTQFVPSVTEALELSGSYLKIPIVYNCGGYESLDTIKMLEDYVDIWLPDLKYFDDEKALRYSSCHNYFSTAVRAVERMQAVAGSPVYDSDGMMKSGVIIRHLVLPGMRKDSLSIFEALKERITPKSVVVSIMSQYLPLHRAKSFKELSRRVFTYEYRYVLDGILKLGFEGYSQDRESSCEDYIPEFTDSKPDFDRL